MNHKMIQEEIDLYLHDELSPAQRTEFEEHIHKCPACAAELEQIRRLEDTVKIHRKPLIVDDRLLQEARQQLRAALRVERSRPNLSTSWSEFFDWLPALNYKVIAGGAVMLIGGILVGRTFLAPSSPAIASGPMVEPIPVASSPVAEEPRIMNLQFNQTGTKSGEVDFTFDAVTSVHLKGNINDEKIQAILAHALVTEQNPGVRLRSVNMLASQGEQLNPPDPRVKSSLISALRSDDNPAVRREALRVLKSFPIDNEIREAFLHVLVHDKNPGLRIAAINSLDSARVQTREAGPDLLEVLKEKMRSDNNNYVRIRAKEVLKEATHQ